MLLVQLGRQVIHEINTVTAASLADQVALSNAQGTHHQLLLTSRQDVGCIIGRQSKTQISALRTSLGMAHLLIAKEGGGEYFVEFPVLVPASVIAQGQPVKLDQFAQGSLEDGLQGLDVVATVFIYFRAGQAQFPVPGGLRSWVKCTMPQP
ncbi:hypothetical protein D3C81_763550 [compost metagenome]